MNVYEIAGVEHRVCSIGEKSSSLNKIYSVQEFIRKFEIRISSDAFYIIFSSMWINEDACVQTCVLQ